MGFFSWKTQDTDRSIANNYSKQPTFPVYMTDNKGNRWEEVNTQVKVSLVVRITLNYWLR